MKSKTDSLGAKIGSLESEVGLPGSKLKTEIGSLESRIESKINSLEAEIKLVKVELSRIKWLLVFFNAGIISLIIKAFI